MDAAVARGHVTVVAREQVHRVEVAPLAENRITSYNVCYTKLLRNLLLTLLDRVGVEVDSIGDSTGRISPDLISA